MWFSTGVWLGIERRTGQLIAYDPSMEAIRHARTLIAMPRPQKWSTDATHNVAATPWSQHEGSTPEVIKEDQGFGSDRPARAPVVHRAYIRQEDLDAIDELIRSRPTRRGKKLKTLLRTPYFRQ